MSNKSVLFGALGLAPESVTEATYPTLTVPANPTTAEDAIIAAAKAEIEIVKWLNAYAGIKVKDLYGMVGMLSPSAQAIAASLLQSDGTSETGATVEEVVKILGAEADGGSFTAIYEDPTRREDTGGELNMYNEAVSLVPAVANYAGALAPLIDLAVTLFSKPGRVGEQVGLILFQQVCDFIKQIVINELYDDNNPPAVDTVQLRKIVEALVDDEEPNEGKPLLKRAVTLLEEEVVREEVVNVDDVIIFGRTGVVTPAP